MEIDPRQKVRAESLAKSFRSNSLPRFAFHIEGLAETKEKFCVITISGEWCPLQVVLYISRTVAVFVQELGIMS